MVLKIMYRLRKALVQVAFFDVLPLLDILNAKEEWGIRNML